MKFRRKHISAGPVGGKKTPLLTGVDGAHLRNLFNLIFIHFMRNNNSVSWDFRVAPGYTWMEASLLGVSRIVEMRFGSWKGAAAH